MRSLKDIKPYRRKSWLEETKFLWKTNHEWEREHILKLDETDSKVRTIVTTNLVTVRTYIVTTWETRVSIWVKLNSTIETKSDATI